MSPRSTGGVADPVHLDRPRLAEDVVLHPPAEQDAPWILQKGTHQYIRIGEDLAALSRALDGAADHASLAGALGPRWTPALVGQAVGQLADKGMIADGRPPARRRRVRVLGPHRIQLTLLHPERLLAVLRPVAAVAGHRLSLGAGALVVLAGLVALVTLRSDVSLAMGSPLPLVGYLAVGVGFLLTTCVHELAHGAVLTALGGRPTRMGVMLFYFTPAFFCDVTDGWRLPRRHQRVVVALAGIAVQLVVGGLAALAAVVAPLEARQTLLVFAVLTYVACVMNLLPFIKLDGYLALMSALDVPHLREKAMADARSWLASTFLGARRERSLPQLSWAVPFGLGCMGMPVYIVGTLLLVLSDMLLGLGIVGATALLLVAGGGVAYVVVGLVRLGRQARRCGAPVGRTAAVSIGTAAAVVVAGAVVQVPVTVNGGYVVHDGAAHLVLMNGADDVGAGADVALVRRGLLTSHTLTSAELTAEGARPVPTPFEAFLPVAGTDVSVPLPGRPLSVAELPPERVGGAVVDLGMLPLWGWLAHTYLEPMGLELAAPPHDEETSR
ncbi:putative peptide zinc metalloprotease protein [Georgenia satyanarayanai]|uniref:Putative peptide zinc metalloprotease protein n=1 Tax=Georgenia satyanarayanai TaxID=860221 RepID=A0A2Y9BZQ4_9MICO|nr:daptide biosynthesis intramembrane metalloprotease [Georgenia satyanarayanai]PYF98934.1 putative peptide zinc metalloprotease protein [Georgenia satyanarayanai]SSA44782.1 putative peptide zinc metalloprotease protein [Georgenia satyanarayanai]